MRTSTALDGIQLPVALEARFDMADNVVPCGSVRIAVQSMVQSHQREKTERAHRVPHRSRANLLNMLSAEPVRDGTASMRSLGVS